MANHEEVKHYEINIYMLWPTLKLRMVWESFQKEPPSWIGHLLKNVRN